jgi:hypothetical protein
MKKLPIERIMIYRMMDSASGLPSPHSELGFVNIPVEAFDWCEIGTLYPDELGKYRYIQISSWPYPPIDAPILRKIADRIEVLNSRAQVNKTINDST